MSLKIDHIFKLIVTFYVESKVTKLFAKKALRTFLAPSAKWVLNDAAF